jgi:tetratricopeptide (TPR) repeat protein
MKKSFVLLIFTFFALNVFSVDLINEDSVQSYRDAKSFFLNKEYGKALDKCEEAITFRKENVLEEVSIITEALKPKQVQRAGDDLSTVLQILNERNEKRPISIINKYIKLKGEDYFGNSISKLISHIQQKEHYPEVYKLIGDIYKLEGEYNFAEDYYKKALDNSNVLNIPNDRFELLYSLAEISEINEDYKRMEIRLLNILTEDNTYKNKALSKALLNTVVSNKNDCFEKFFELYRGNNYFSLKAYSKLSDYYYSTKDYDKAFNFCALNVITSITKIQDVISSRDITFEFKNIENLLYHVQYYDDIIKWGNDNEIWTSFNLLAKITKELGNKDFSEKLLKVLAQFSPEEYWRKEAVLQLSYLSAE